MNPEENRFADVSAKELEAIANKISLALKEGSDEDDDLVIFSATNHGFDNDFKWLRNLMTPG